MNVALLIISAVGHKFTTAKFNFYRNISCLCHVYRNWLEFFGGRSLARACARKFFMRTGARVYRMTQWPFDPECPACITTWCIAGGSRFCSVLPSRTEGSNLRALTFHGEEESSAGTPTFCLSPINHRVILSWRHSRGAVTVIFVRLRFLQYICSNQFNFCFFYRLFFNILRHA